MSKVIFPRETASNAANILTTVYNAPQGSYRLRSVDKGAAEAELNPEISYKPRPEISLDDTGMNAYLSLYPPANSDPLNLDEIMSAVELAGIQYGLNKAALERIVAGNAEGLVQEEVHIAQGIEPTDGKDAFVVLYFNNISKKPKISADGTVDYKNLDSIINVTKGECLLTKRPPTPGIRGLTVRNAEIPPKPGNDVTISCGEGVMVNPARTNYKATKDGYVSFLNGKISVNDVLKVDGDINLSTGNLSFNGTIHVKGDVLSGFRLEGKDVIVDGVCGDCEIISKQNIFLNGVKASGENNLFQADGDINVVFCENAKLHAKNNISIKKYAYNSELFSGGVIDADSGEGIIAGGEVRAFNEARVRQLGTKASIRFVVYMGSKYHMDLRLMTLKKSAELLSGKLEEMDTVFGKLGEVLADDDMKAIQELKDSREDVAVLVEDILRKQEELKRDTRADNPKIKVREKAFGGVTVSFFGNQSTLKEDIEHAVFYYDKKFAEVAWVSLKDAENSQF